jgi:Protein of unknown function (DUF4232)
MRSPKAGMPRIVSLSRRLAAVGSLALLLAGCSTSAATPSVAPTATPDFTAVPSTPTTTPTDTPTLAPTETPTAAPAAPSVVTAPPAATTVPKAVPTAPPAATPKPTPTPPPALAIGLCTGAQLSLSITSWVGDPGADPIYAHVTATNVSSASCNMRGASEAQILNAGGTVIADAGSGAATVKSSDPVYALAPNGTINTIVQWGNWCKAAPTQNLKVAMVEPFGLGRIVAPANGVAKVPSCSASGSATVVSSEAWLP